jgi:hypothetical protein
VATESKPSFSLEPLADAMFAADQIEKLLPRLRPMRDALRTIQELHSTIKSRDNEIARLKILLAAK